jgi:hypothetical protein
MTEAEQFAKADAAQGNTMLVFYSAAIAKRYIAHRATLGQTGLIAMIEDTKFGSGLTVVWRDPIEQGKVEERLANCHWLLEEVLRGRCPAPVPGEVGVLWERGNMPQRGA